MKNMISTLLVLSIMMCLPFSVNAQEYVTVYTNTPTPVEEQLVETPTDVVGFGDISEDGVINAKDALVVLRAAVCKHHFTSYQMLIADITRDNKINAQDALEMLRYAVGKPSALEPITINMQTVFGDTYTQDTVQGKAWKAQLATVEVYGGIKTHMETKSAQVLEDEFVRGVMAGRVPTDVAEVSLYTARNIIRKKVALNLWKSQTLSRDLCNNGATQSLTFGEKTYGVSFPRKNTSITGVFYNKELVAQYAPNVNIQELYAKKEWTFDAFQTLAKQCTVDLDEDGKTDCYGVVSNANLMAMAGSSNAGGTALMKNGRVEAAFCNDNSIAALEWCKTLYKTDKSWRYRADIKTCVEEFAQGKAAMFASYTYFAQSISQTARFEMGFVPMPIGPAQEDYVNSVYDAYVYIVPLTKQKEANQVGAWLNGMAIGSQMILEAECQQLAGYGVDEKGCEAYKNAVLSPTADFTTGVFSQTVASMYEGVANNWGESSQHLDALRTAAQQELDDFYAPLY